MHPKNLHNTPYQFKKLLEKHTALAPFIITNEFGNNTIDFANPIAVLELNKALLKVHYNVKHWDIPKNYLCAPIPGRADYVHHLADILNNENVINNIKGLDIGVGANCIYPILGKTIYNWQMVGADINETAVTNAKQIVAANTNLIDSIEIRKQNSNANIFTGIIKPNEKFDFTMCNPPFHSSEKEATKGTQRKLKNLGKQTSELELNFGGMANELWCNGGEALFLKRLIKESVLFKNQVTIFTSLVSKSDNLPKLQKQLTKLKAIHFIIPMQQGNKKSRILAWKFNA
ncbi:23S rRNA (adenine(1618)-N(6))-methyltransferase RlmF [Cellulophaga omnivescoria]|uniref:23S rRNA (adenine(1618)-N(6))-methyltransferase RlmF n=1 Tax=Cellulophaga omnivescoria TaxID=1888890 RepID=UPI0022F0F086|nr:23S rRNA (adenine(1618)-N(6))-methyltransferase RlmF [Cellulophaga omnivescoria]WBU89006.1 23S rRNA (adenine(1618)-N(6))-methyltransferase RlmF [Cellulophaga omnivescoria]